MAFEYLEEPLPAPVHEEVSCAGITHFFLRQTYKMVVCALVRLASDASEGKKWTVTELEAGFICF